MNRQSPDFLASKAFTQNQTLEKPIRPSTYCTTQRNFLSPFAYGQQLAANLMQPTVMV